MNTSKPLRQAAPVPEFGGSAARLTFADLMLREEDLAPLRRSLYHSRGEGYVVLRSFLDAEAVAHLRAIWSECDPAATHVPFPGKLHIYDGCPDYYVLDQAGNRTFYNFFWNPPLDELTCAIAGCVQMLRNRVSGRVPFAEMYAFAGKALDYRVIISRQATTWAAPHRDYFDYARRFEKNRYDLSRLQATLFLAEKGADYSGTGFKFQGNDGASIVFGSDVAIRAGDLVIWRYNNQHSVEDIRTDPGQFGFMRMIFPPEDIHPARPDRQWPGAGRLVALTKRLRRALGGRG